MKNRKQKIARAIEGLERIDPQTVKEEKHWHLQAWQAATSAIRTIEELEEENDALRAGMGNAITLLLVPYWRDVRMGVSCKRLTITLPVKTHQTLMESLTLLKEIVK